MVRKLFGILLLAWASLGLHAGSDWKAQWINADRCQSATNTWLIYRKTVTIGEVPERLVARIAADTKYWLWINGRLAVFEGGLKRGPSPDGTYYDPVDIAPYLVEGENTIAILLWHFGKSGFTHVNSGLAALLFEAVAPGIEILSDGSWQCDLYDAYQNTEAPFPNYRLPESNIRFDARLERIGWNQPDYEKSLPPAVVVADAASEPLGHLVERPIPLWKDYGLKPYVEVRQSPAGDTLYCRLPYNCQATPYLKVEAPAGVNELGETFYALSPSSHKLAVKGIHELMNWQRPDGVIFSPMPSANWRKELPLQMLASVGWYGFYTQYYYSGDSSFVADVYDRVHRYLHEVWQVDDEGLAIVRPGDWNWGDWGEHVDLGVLTNCWYYLALKAERAFAIQLGKMADVERIDRMMRDLAGNFDKRYWTGRAYRSSDYEGQTDDRAQAMAVVSGLASKDKYPALLKVLREEEHASPYMEKYVLEALFRMEEPDEAFDRMRRRYKKMLSYDEYTTLFEGWGIGAEGFGGGTTNHAWSGGPLTLLSQKVCGIEPTSPGFHSFRVAPMMGSLREASATVDTRYGLIQVSLEKKGDRIGMVLVVPEGTRAEVPVAKERVEYFNPGRHELMINK